jgi:hypothetical protein
MTVASLVATTADINGGTVDNATIATSDITVGAGKTLNVSAGTLTLADNQISGDKVEGGTINAITINTLGSTTGNITTVNATTVDTTNIEVTNIKAKDGTAAGSIADSTGVVTIASSVLTTTDINGGTIDGATIATSDITVGTGKTLNVSSGTLTLANDQISGDKVEGGTINAITINTLGSTTGNITTVNATTVDSTNVEVTNIKAKDGTASATIADSTGVMTIASSVLTTADINGGTIDGTVIGGASAAAGTFTDVGADALDLAAIAATKAVTAVDVFVYDTSKDSDGGAWRKRTQGTSWYQETLNTTTRGARREFPAVAVIVAEAAKVTIYDGDDPALPMWHVEDYTGLTIRAAVAINGQIWIGTSTGVIASDYAGDDLGTTTLDYTTSTTPAIVNNSVNDIAATVLPDAPIDPATGLPVPTIAVATAGGVSVITDSGAVYDSASTTAKTNIEIIGDYIFFRTVAAAEAIQTYRLSTIAADGFVVDRYYRREDGTAGQYPQISNSAANSFISGRDTNDIAVGYVVGGLWRLQQGATGSNGAYPDDAVAKVTSTYNTGWMNGDIKGAFLSDTDDTDLVGSGELVTNGTFDTDTSGWTAGNATLSVVSNKLQIVSDGAGIAFAEQTLSGLTVGQTYLLEATGEITAGSSKAFVTLYTGTGTFIANAISNVSAETTGTLTFVATQTSMRVRLQLLTPTGAGDTGLFDNISVKLADADRSVNNKGLIVNGTVTRSPVATGADLVAYSGFSASNYLEQPVNTGLDFGTGDFAIMGWLKQAANTAVETILERDSAVSAQRFTLAVNASGFLTFTCDDDTTARTATSNRIVDNDVWTHFVALYDGAGNVKIYLNGVLDDTETGSALLTLNNASAVLRVGLAVDDAEPLDNADLALLRISATVPSDSQIKKIYEDEKFLFQDGAQATLYGASDAVTALAHDPVTDLLHVGTSAGRSVFSGLRRVSNTTTAVGTAISASNGLVVEE